MLQHLYNTTGSAYIHDLIISLHNLLDNPKESITFATVKRKRRMLKQLLHIIFVLLLFTSCGHRSREMSEALIRAEEMNLNYQSMDTLTGMEQVADYYRPLIGRSHMYMRALYMLGCVYRDRGDAPMALHYYQEAVSQADTTDAECDFHTLCRIYGQMSSLYHRQRSPQLELEAERKAYAAAMKAKDTLAAISYYECMTGAYYALGKKDTALAIVENTMSLYAKKNEKAKAAAEMGVASDFYIEKKDFKRADSLLRQYEAYSGFFNNKGEITPGRETYYYTKGTYYEGIGNTDSALYFYRKLLKYPDEIMNLELGYQGLMNIYHQLGMADSTIKYTRLYAQANDSANIIHSAEEITRTQALYNYSESQRMAAEKSAEANRYKFLLLFSVSAFLLCLLAVYIIVLHIRRYKGEADERERLLHTRLAELEQQLTIKEIRDMEQEILASPLVNSFRMMAKTSVKKPTHEEWSQLHSFLRDRLPAFWNKLQESEPPLRKEEVDVCLLIRLQFPVKEIANLTGMSVQAISNVRRRLLQRVFHQSEGGSKEFDRLIMKL